MFYLISGKVIQKGSNFVVVKTSGVGFKIFVLNEVVESLKIGKGVKLFVFFYQEHFELYGFLKDSERLFFELLNGVSGMGPKNAMKVMNLLDIESIKLAIVNQDIRMLKDAGISLKTAQKMIFELKDKIEKEGLNLTPLSRSTNQELKEALKSLGYSKKEIDFVLPKISKSLTKTEDKIKQALKILAAHRQ
jgi:Holliday junction DNA helicase RuvA